MSKSISQQQLAVRMAMISLVLWIVSLGLVGFSFDSGTTFCGVEILLWGLFFGWSSVDYLTVYSNIFYLPTVLMLSAGKKPTTSVVFMALLGVLLLFSVFGTIKINTDPTNLGGSSSSPVISWGWGAFLLLFAQSLIVVSALLAHQKISVKLSYILTGLLILPITGIGTFSAYQRNQANDWEMAYYFPTYDVAFTKKPLSGLPYKALTEKLPDNAGIDIQFIGNVTPLIAENDAAYPRSYWQNGRFWHQYHSRIYDINHFAITIDNEQAPHYRMIISNPKPNYYLYTLYNDENIILYQQAFTVPKEKWNNNGYYVQPYLFREIPDDVRYRGYRYRENQKLLWQSETGAETCFIKKIDTGNPNTIIWQWENQQLLRLFAYDKDQKRAKTNFSPKWTLCSQHYRLAITASFHSAWLFERKSGLPVASFYSHHKKTAPNIQKDEIKQFELIVVEKKKNEEDKSYLVLHTDKGDIKLRLLKRQGEL